MKLTLNIWTADNEPLATFVWSNGTTVIHSAVGAIRQDAERWLARGLLEWIRTPNDASPRVTPSSAQEFLPRLARYLENQFSFKPSWLYELPSSNPATTWRWNLPVGSTGGLTAVRKTLPPEPALLNAAPQNSIEMVR